MIAMGFPMNIESRALSIMASMFMVLVLLPTANGEMVDGEFEIEYYPEPVIIGPGGEAIVTITAKSHSEGSLDLLFEFVPVDAPRHSEGVFTMIFTTLGPGAEKTNELVVRSNAQRSDEESYSDFKVVVYWGGNIKIDRENNPLLSSVDGTWEHEFSVLYDPEPELGYLPLAIVMVLVIGVAVILLYPQWTGHKDRR